MPPAVELALSLILVGPRLRPVDHGFAAELAVAMQESGQLTPVLVRPARSEDGEPGFELVAGAHRHAAVRKLGWETIRAEVRELTDDEARLVEADENLIRRDLNAHERAMSIAARLEAWGRKYPDRITRDAVGAKPKKGRPGKADKMSDFLGGRSATMGFAADTAGEVGLSAKTVLRALEVHRGIPSALHARIGSTWIAKNEGTLRQLAGIGDPAEQGRIVEVLLSGGARTVSDARAIAAGARPTRETASEDEARVAKIIALFGQCSPTYRRAVLRRLAGRSLPAGCRVEVDGGA